MVSNLKFVKLNRKVGHICPRIGVSHVGDGFVWISTAFSVMLSSPDHVEGY